MPLDTAGLSQTWTARLGLIFIVAFFCVPLFIGLRSWDIRNDEAIYDYAVDRILETGEWLTPRSIPSDDPFLEKPPLKFWIVAAGIKSGLLPFDEFGLRFFDALFCAVAFVYVYLLGRMLGGTAGGVVSVFLLYSFDPLIFEHGVRENNMESTLVLTYCGGMYHFVRWIETDASGRRRAHAVACAAYFALGFMTKFVAALFLPFVCAIALTIRPGGLRRLRDQWTDWIAPVGVAAVVILPWFIYQTVHSGKVFWDTIVMVHVYTRFLGTLIASHIQPWNHYFLQTWTEIGYENMLPIWVAGLGVLAWRAWIERQWLARFLFLWWIVPFVIMSMGTSKIFYYAYPFIPPLAIGGGAAAAALLDFLGHQIRLLAVRLGASTLAPELDAARRQHRRSLVLGVIGGLAVGMAVWTFVSGPVTLEAGGWRLFRNSSVARPLFVGALLWHFAGYGGIVFRIAAIAVLALFLPLSRYTYKLDRFLTAAHPLRSTRDCVLSVQASGANVGKGIFELSGDMHHAYYYYLRRTGPWLGAEGWVHPGPTRPDELNRRLETPGEMTPVILSAQDYRGLGGVLPGSTAVSYPALAAPLNLGLPPGIAIGDVVVILFPGPYGVCAAPVAEGGARLLPAWPPGHLGNGKD